MPELARIIGIWKGSRCFSKKEVEEAIACMITHFNDRRPREGSMIMRVISFETKSCRGGGDL